MIQSNPAGTVTKAIEGLVTEREAASELLWDFYFERLCRFATTKIAKGQTRLIDNEAVAASAMYALLDGIENERFGLIGNRDELWRILVTVATRKAQDARRHHLCAKRGAGLIRGDSVFSTMGLEAIIADQRGDSDPRDCLEVESVLEELNNQLPDDNYRQITRLRLAGYSNQEIAQTLNCSPRTIIRKLTLIQSTLSSLCET